MINKLLVIGMLAMFLSATTYAAAEDVYITQQGTKYHKEDCRLIKNKENVTKMDKKQAIEEGYGPCKTCFKEDIVAGEGQKEQKQAKKSK
ncbi:MAG: hypothetical protein JW847_00620 [Candidatus Omnitrophica bacterium]|nr:hypothetical protein [Candidatus Omnitrophota bacterium]